MTVSVFGYLILIITDFCEFISTFPRLKRYTTDSRQCLTTFTNTSRLIKNICYASYFQLSSWCWEMWSNKSYAFDILHEILYMYIQNLLLQNHLHSKTILSHFFLVQKSRILHHQRSSLLRLLPEVALHCHCRHCFESLLMDTLESCYGVCPVCRERKPRFTLLDRGRSRIFTRRGAPLRNGITDW